ncbi:cytochrome P450 [Gloeophyllum trabeum ATCC 11539]|uniref:Cytochrome P450 n=1 Tax=Gloeophyllum trabeum (strain ATCC 11539 / FP-39264 / Madison 617) TaxID=670483 RepID=S7Q091_GLOTA|nr:cytochrome P450 [Gloeophyllum trabeum ATCC 11539]EPQ53108.1 cytochrome P450 [Gloeophyllum trabeum ATCC 11539]
MIFAIIQWGLVASIVLVALYHLQQRLTNRILRKIPGPTPSSAITGSFQDLYHTQAWSFHQAHLDQYGAVAKVQGLLGEQMLYISDPLALYHMMVKEEPIYDEFAFFYPLNYLLWGEGLLSVHGMTHRKQRKMLNPVFNAKHLREMCPIFHDVAQELRAVIKDKVQRGEAEIDMLDWMTRTALELIGRAGLGYSFKIMQEGTVDEYGSAVKSLFPHVFEFAVVLPILPYLMKIGSPRFRRFMVEITPNKKIRRIKEMIDIMWKTSLNIYQTKVAALSKGDEALAKEVGQGKDIITLLLRANMMASEEERLPLSQVLGQMTYTMDTTSSALSRMLYLLALNPDVQAKLRQEVREARAKGELDYDVLDKLPYLDAVCRETLRLHPPVTTLERRTTKDTVLPLSTPVRGIDGIMIDQIPLAKDTRIIASVLSFNRDKTVWGEDAYEWKPERWLRLTPPGATDSKSPGVYSNMMTFSGGIRGCIGFKFSLLETKEVLMTLIESFRFEPVEKKSITWDLGIITTPRVEHTENNGPTLPLKVSIAEKLAE